MTILLLYMDILVEDCEPISPVILTYWANVVKILLTIFSFSVTIDY